MRTFTTREIGPQGHTITAASKSEAAFSVPVNGPAASVLLEIRIPPMYTLTDMTAGESRTGLLEARRV